MATILITGVSGFVGSRLVQRLRAKHQVLALSRKEPEIPGGGYAFIQGAFHDPDTLAQLDEHKIDALVHLAAVTGGCSEEDGLAVNVLGTQRLVRHLIDRDCKRFILASSIAAVGCLNGPFDPCQVPIPPDHPCLASDAYGLSKAMMETLADYFHRKHPDTSFTNFRIGAVWDDETVEPQPLRAGDLEGLPWLFLARVMVSDVLDALEVAVAKDLAGELPGAGVRRLNLVGPDAACDDPVTEVLKAWDPQRAGKLDLSYFERPGHEFDPVYSMKETEQALGFVPTRSVRPERIAD